MPRKKRKKRENLARESEFRPPRQETARGKELIDEKLVKAGAVRGATPDDFSEGGFGCTHCAWTTPKKGNSGIQALRAHSKVHVRDRRTVVKTLIVQVTVLVVAIATALSPFFMGLVSSDAIVEMRLYVPVNAELIIATTVATSILLTITIPLTGYRYLLTGKRRWWFRYRWLVRMLVVLIWSAAGSVWLNFGQDIRLQWLTPVLVPWVFWFWVGNPVALTRLAVMRRKFEPPNQRKLLKSKSKITDHRISILRRGTERGIRNGQTVLGNLTRMQRDYLNRLGLGKTRLDKRTQQRRLKWEEEVRLKIEQRNLRFRRDQDHRRKRGDD